MCVSISCVTVEWVGDDTCLLCDTYMKHGRTAKDFASSDKMRDLFDEKVCYDVMILMCVCVSYSKRSLLLKVSVDIIACM